MICVLSIFYFTKISSKVYTKPNFEIFGKIDNPPRCIQDLKEVKTEIARISGAWMERIDVNGVTYWAADKSIYCNFYDCLTKLRIKIF